MNKLDVLSIAAENSVRRVGTIDIKDIVVRTACDKARDGSRCRIYINDRFTKLAKAAKWGWAYVGKNNRLYIFTDEDIDGVRLPLYKPNKHKGAHAITFTGKEFRKILEALGGTVEGNLLFDQKAEMYYYQF